jgi:hypothetical protein
MGIEAQKTRCELLRPECIAYQNYNRENHFAAIHLREIIGKNFNKADLMSMAADLGGWTGIRCPRNWVRLEALILCYLMQNRLILINKWKEGQFKLQQREFHESAESTGSFDITFVRDSEDASEPLEPSEASDADVSSRSTEHAACPGRIWWGD